MKKILIALFMTFITGTIFAQGIYFRGGAGYGLPAATIPIGEKYLHTEIYNGNNSISTYSTDIVSASYGAGANLTFAVGYKFNENFLFDLDIRYLSGKKYETSNIYKYESSSYSSKSEDIFTTSSRGFFFNPSFVFSAGFGKGAPYGRFGLIAASPKISSDESYFDNGDGEVARNITWEYKKGIAFGYQAAIGMNWKISDKLDFYTEADFVNMTYYAKEADMTRNVYNGSDNLPQMSVSQKQILYKKKYDPQTSYNAGAPQIAAREASPLSSFSVQVGVKFTLWEVVK